jgi:hypothetical protein
MSASSNMGHVTEEEAQNVTRRQIRHLRRQLYEANMLIMLGYSLIERHAQPTNSFGA